jgi:hypothetical protein
MRSDLRHILSMIGISFLVSIAVAYGPACLLLMNAAYIAAKHDHSQRVQQRAYQLFRTDHYPYVVDYTPEMRSLYLHWALKEDQGQSLAAIRYQTDLSIENDSIEEHHERMANQRDLLAEPLPDWLLSTD